jgi:NIPSNAP
VAILEIRTYRLKPGTRDEFVRVMKEESAPLLAAAGIRVVDAGSSQVDEDGFEEAYLVRAFDSLERRAAQEDAFYSSAIWREGPREAIVSRIEAYHTIVVEVPEAVIENWRPAGR